jgi:uncharacterized protein (TIGR02246 family)
MLLSAMARLAPAMAEELTETRQATARGTIDGVLSERLFGGWNKHDAHLYASAFSPDADFTDLRGDSVTGRDNIEKFHAEVFARSLGRSQLAALVEKVRFLSAEVAVVDVAWKMTATDAAGHTLPARNGQLDLVFTADGPQWLITVMHEAEFGGATHR